MNSLQKVTQEIQQGMDNGELRVKQIYSERDGKKVRYVIDVLELDKGEMKDALSIKVDVDTTEALKQMKELTNVTYACVEAFEKLEKVVGGLQTKSGLISSGVGNLTLDEKLYLAGRGPLPVEND